MSSKADVTGDGSSPFLLPFEEVPKCSLALLKKAPENNNAGIGNPDKPFVSALEEQGMDRTRQYFEVCNVCRTSEKLMPDGPMQEDHSGVFCITVGQHVLLRPEDNSLRPGVAKVVTFFKETGSESCFLRVQWYYRAEDLTETPGEAIGEDEVFETQHFDDVDAESIAGRCRVTSYSEWIEALASKRRMLLQLRARYDEVRNGENGSGGDLRRNSHISGDDFDSQNANETRQGGLKRPAHDRVGEICDEEMPDMLREEGVIRELSESSNLVTVEPGAEPQDDDEMLTSFRENYPDSSLFYFCRRFYDPLTNSLLVSTHENENAEPAEEILARRGTDVGGRAVGEEDFHVDDVSSSFSSASSDEIVSSDEERGGSRPSRKRKRPNGKLTPSKKRHRAASASQFSLPDEIGVPAILPCRDSQKEQVENFLLSAINGSAADGQGGSRCLYISGVPGTGKTATVREVVRTLTARRAAGKLPPFEVVEVNAMSLPDPHLVYFELYAAITGNRQVSPMHAAQLLEKRFADGVKTQSRRAKRSRGGPVARGQDPCTILVLDEMDVLLARKQKVLYDVLEWPTRKNARMAVIGIANTMDLPERILPRLGSRLGVNRLSYPPYTSTQLQTILDTSLDETDVEYSKAAIQLCVKKVGSVSGDVRRALELCRRASEILLESQSNSRGHSQGKVRKPVVKATHMQEAIQDIAGGARLVALTQMSVFERLVLASAINLARRQGSSAVERTCSMAAITSEAMRFSRNTAFSRDNGTPSTHELEEACWRLASTRIVLIERAAVYRNSRIIVNVSSDDCVFALRDCELVQTLLGESKTSRKS